MTLLIPSKHAHPHSFVSPRLYQPSITYLVLPLLLIMLHSSLHAATWSGSNSVEARLFPNSPLDSQQVNNSLSVSLQGELFHASKDDRHNLIFTPFLRIDPSDDERSHFDIRELSWTQIHQDWELTLGIQKVFWGVTESHHLVDIINQTDLVEAIDGEEKLGQPMINLSLIRSWGIIDFYLLPGFRERTYPGIDGRLRTQPRVDTSNPNYESSKKERHIDAAIRWFHSIGDIDIGLHYFKGTNRDPLLQLATDALGNPVLIPHYALIDQSGIDLQMTLENWLLKLEAIQRSDQLSTYSASTLGFEYSFYGVFETDMDIGVVTEYLYDDRGTSGPTIFQNDALLGLRFALNDVQSTTALIGILTDLDHHSHLASLEASRRLGEQWTIDIVARTSLSAKPSDISYALRRDDVVEATLSYHY